MKVTFLNNRTIVFALLLAACLVSLKVTQRTYATAGQLPKRSGYINDFAEVLDAPTKQRLEAILANLKEKTGLDFVIATVKTVGSEDLYDYSLQVANNWNVGAPASTNKSLLLLITADNSRLFAQVSRSARAYLPDGVVGEMGRRVREKLDTSGFNASLLTGVRSLIDAVGAQHDFTFAAIDPEGGAENLIAQRQRPRTVRTPDAQPTETPAPAAGESPLPKESPTPAVVESPSPQPTESPLPAPTPQETPVAPIETPSPTPVESPTPEATPTVSPEAPVPAESPTPSPAASSSPTETPTPDNSPSLPGASPKAQTIAADARPTRSSATGRGSANVNSNPDDEKEAVELTLTLPLTKRIDALKAFISSHPGSVAVPRANELLVMAHALLADQKMKAGDNEGGLQQFRAAIAAAPADMPDRLFAEVIARIPLNLFFRSQHEAAFEFARQAEVLAQSNSKRLLALTEFYLAIENADEAGRIAEAALKVDANSAPAHYALGAARHIALRLDEAENEYARALELDAKSGPARIALADLRRAAGNFEGALTLYREQLQADEKSNRARAGMILSLLELGRKDEADAELTRVLQDKELAQNLPLLVGGSYWFMAHNDAARGLDLAQRAVALEPRYSWGQIAFARALVADRRPLQAERALRFARQYGRFSTMDYELASVLASVGLYDEAVRELARSFTLKNGEIETRLAGRITAHASSFSELLAPERRAAIFQKTGVDAETNASMLKALLAFDVALNQPSPNEDDVIDKAQQFIKGDDPMRTFRRIYVADKFIKKGIALANVVDLMDQAMSGVEIALSVAAVTVAVQPEEIGDMRASALARGETPEVPQAPRSALSGILRGRIEDLAGVALFNLDKPAEAVTRLKRAVASAPEGTPLWRSALWHLGSALEASGKSDEALLYYIKSYVRGAPDPARRSIIENVYKKVNGTLDGLDDKIGPPPTATPTPRPTPA